MIFEYTCTIEEPQILCDCENPLVEFMVLEELKIWYCPLIVLLYPRLCVIGWETMIYRNVHTHLSPITLHSSLSHTTRRFSLVHTASSCPWQLTVIATTDSVLFFIESAVDPFEFSVINPVFLYANKQLFKYICHDH